MIQRTSAAVLLCALFPHSNWASAAQVEPLTLSSPQESVAKNERLDAKKWEALVDRIACGAFAGNAAGLSVAAILDGKVIVSKGFGYAELEHGALANADTLFRIGSVTKQFTAALVMQQVEAGTIGLDDSIAKYCDFPTGEHTVTIRHLLTHTSGIKSYTGLGEAWTKTIPLELTEEQLLDLVDEEPFDFAPGTTFKYNNTGYFLLGVILERVTGMEYEDLIEEKIAKPLGLSKTRYGSNRDLIRNRAQGYTRAKDGFRNDALIGMSQPGAAGALLSTAGDLVRWSHALATGKVVSAESYAAMTTSYELPDGSQTKYGFGLGLAALQDMPVVTHGGGINGFNSMLTHFPSSGVTIAVISNCESYSAGGFADAIGDAIHGVALKTTDFRASRSERARLAATYVLEDKTEIAVRAEGKHLFATYGGKSEVRLMRQSTGIFCVEGAEGSWYVFERGDPSPTVTVFAAESVLLGRGSRRD